MSNVIPIRVLRLARVFAQFDRIVAERDLERGLPVQPPEQSPLQRAYERHQVLLAQEPPELPVKKPERVSGHFKLKIVS